MQRSSQLSGSASVAMPSVLQRPHRAVGDFMRDIIRSEELGDATAFYVSDLAVVASRFREFSCALPRVTPYYAVKCNPDPIVVRTLAQLGAGFDCASREEIRIVASAIPPEQLGKRVVYANPCKAADHLRYAVLRGVHMMTFDSADELRKVSKIAPNARLLLRLAVEDSQSLLPLSSKFGARDNEVPDLLRDAVKMRLNVVGVAFHVGSGCTSANSYVAALKQARNVFDLAQTIGLPPFTVLDVGGGFPGRDGEAPITFSQIAATMRPCLDQLFHSGVEVIAEPGRYFVSAAYSLAAQILSCRSRAPYVDYYISDGVYGSFKDVLLCDVFYAARPLLVSNSSQERDRACRGNVYGPTQDPFDVVLRDVVLPKLSIGDWIFFPNMGAYTSSLATNLAGVPRPPVHYCNGNTV